MLYLRQYRHPPGLGEARRRLEVRDTEVQQSGSGRSWVGPVVVVRSCVCGRVQSACLSSHVRPWSCDRLCRNKNRTAVEKAQPCPDGFSLQAGIGQDTDGNS